MVFSFGSALVGGSPFECRYVCYVLDNARACSSSYDCLDSWLVWSFTELATGRWLQHSPWNEPMNHRSGIAGERIAGPWRGILVAIRGDEKALAKLFHFRRTWVSHNVCGSCMASRVPGSPLLYTQYGETAEHRKTLLDMNQFVAELCDSNAWVRLPGFLPWMVHYDWLHIFDLAMLPDASASVSHLHANIYRLMQPQFHNATGYRRDM